MTDDLIERLRGYRPFCFTGGKPFGPAICDEAADRIATQQEAIDELVEALRPFAKRADGYESHDGQHDFDEDFVVIEGFGSALPEITVAHYRELRALLSKHGERT